MLDKTKLGEQIMNLKSLFSKKKDTAPVAEVKPIKTKELGKVKTENREKCIVKAMGKRGWSREEAALEVDKTVKRLGISFVEYREQNFCLLDEKDQDRKAVYLKELKAEKKERNDVFV